MRAWRQHVARRELPHRTVTGRAVGGASGLGWDGLQENLAGWRGAVVAHPVYRALDDVPALCTFMEHHVWAVWDFMSLLTRLQRDLTCVQVPWVPRRIDPSLQRLINEIKLGEESDVHPEGGWTSHFGLYVAAMEELGADPGPVRRVVSALAGQTSEAASPVQLARLMVDCGAPAGAARFVLGTYELVTGGSTLAVAAAFALGREQLIPQMFEPLIDGDRGRLLADYLRRHIELDAGEHGPLTQRLVETLAGDEAHAWQAVQSAALEALQARHRLWDDVLQVIEVARASPS